MTILQDSLKINAAEVKQVGAAKSGKMNETRWISLREYVYGDL